jgi:hypothetical protein
MKIEKWPKSLIRRAFLEEKTFSGIITAYGMIFCN